MDPHMWDKVCGRPWKRICKGLGRSMITKFMSSVVKRSSTDSNNSWRIAPNTTA